VSIRRARALDRAAYLRNLDPSAFSWPAISRVMAIYHGFPRSESWWRRELVGSGSVESRPRGVPFKP
jgi:hypothetical protein